MNINFKLLFQRTTRKVELTEAGEKLMISLPRILTAFAKKYPGITVHVRELANLELLEAVRRREVDFAIGPVPERKDELEFAPILDDEYCADRHDPRAKQATLRSRRTENQFTCKSNE